MLKKLMNKKMNKKGFTLAELLIVVAIIAVLVAIAIPIFTTQLEKSREATDLANARSAYAELMVKALDASGESDQTASIDLVQQVEGWTTDMTDVTIGGVAPTGTPTKGGTCEITYTASTAKVTVEFN